jgi:hypothetical protein
VTISGFVNSLRKTTFFLIDASDGVRKASHTRRLKREDINIH